MIYEVSPIAIMIFFAFVALVLGLSFYFAGKTKLFIVATAGMTSTTYVQFIKGGLLILFSVILTIYILNKGLDKDPSAEHHKYISLKVSYDLSGELKLDENSQYSIQGQASNGDNIFYLLLRNGISNWFHLITLEDELFLDEMLTISTDESGNSLYNGAPKLEKRFYQVGHLSKVFSDGEEVESTGRTNPFSFLTKIEDSEVVRYSKTFFEFGGNTVTGWYPVITSGKDIMKPGLLYKLEGASIWEKLNFVSLMLALFLGTSALPHILIRYYTVPSQRDARKSTIIAITAIGFFYILTLYMGLGAMINGVLDMESSNMSGPLLAKSFGLTLFAVISAVAFATVLGTVSGLIVASSGAIAHDLMDKYFKVKMEDKEKVMAGKISAFGVGIFAILLGILLKGMNVSFLVGLAFAVAASANLPAIIMILFWDKTTSNGVSSSIIVGILSLVILILFSPSMFERYGLSPENAWFPMDNPGIVSIPLSFMTLILISLYSQKNSIGNINKNNAMSR